MGDPGAAHAIEQARIAGRHEADMVDPPRAGGAGLFVGHADDVDHGLFAEIEPGARKRKIGTVSAPQPDDVLEEGAGFFDHGGLDVDVVEACDFDRLRLRHLGSWRGNYAGDNLAVTVAKGQYSLKMRAITKRDDFTRNICGASARR